MKVLVYSAMKEARACTGRRVDGEGNFHLQFRQFRPLGPKSPFGKAYMTPEEANFLVESSYVRKHAEAGLQAPYFYPAGFPAPVEDNYEEPFSPPLTEKSFFVSDPRQVEQAQELLRERDEAIAKAKAAEEAEKGDGEGEGDKKPARGGKGGKGGKNAGNAENAGGEQE